MGASAGLVNHRLGNDKGKIARDDLRSALGSLQAKVTPLKCSITVSPLWLDYKPGMMAFFAGAFRRPDCDSPKASQATPCFYFPIRRS